MAETIQMELLEGGRASSGPGEGWIGKGSLTAKQMATLLNGKVITKFEVRVGADPYKDETAVIVFGGGHEVHIEKGGRDATRVHYYKRIG